MGVLIILLGGIFVFGGYRLIRHTPNYDTVKTTNGRTVRFLNYTEAKKRKREKILGILLTLVGFILLSAGILLEVFFKG